MQPLIAKLILPWFGGSAAVWTSCMLFFQVALLGGYAYAHWLNGQSGRTQTVVHAVLLALRRFADVGREKGVHPLWCERVERVLAKEVVRVLGRVKARLSVL